MKKTATTKRGTAPQKSVPEPSGRIHPVIIYPFWQPSDYSNLEALYQMVERLGGEPEKFARPITVVDRKTFATMERDKVFLKFRENVVARHSDILDAWCVDTCQMWYSGLGMAADRGADGDVYWLIPGDFNYGTRVGEEVLDRIHNLPEITLELKQDLCIGEISTDHNNSKQLIDTYGTFALLYTWFSKEAVEIRQYTERPRSEFFAISHSFLHEMLRQRWYAYEQTVVMLLHAIFGGKHISRFCVGNISDLVEGRESLPAVMQQVERTERVLKTFWRERNQHDRLWLERYRLLENKSEQARRTAQGIFENLLT